MPSRNVLKQDAPQSFYHVYARGGNRQRIFREAADFEKFLKLFERYLSPEESRDANGVSFPNYYKKLDLVSFCLMPTHFHLLVYQYQQRAMAAAMKSLLTSYSMYFNRKYKRSGPLFESRYKASRISDDAYVEHITRFIHLDPKQWRLYEYSSLPYYLQQITDTWLHPQRVTERFSSPEAYLMFLEDHIQIKEVKDILKHELANGNEL